MTRKDANSRMLGSFSKPEDELEHPNKVFYKRNKLLHQEEENDNKQKKKEQLRNINKEGKGPLSKNKDPSS